MELLTLDEQSPRVNTQPVRDLKFLISSVAKKQKMVIIETSIQGFP